MLARLHALLVSFVVACSTSGNVRLPDGSGDAGISDAGVDGADAGPDAGPFQDAGPQIPSAAGGPVVFRVSDPVAPGKVALLFGGRIDPDGGAMGWRLPDDPSALPTLTPPVFESVGGTPLAVLAASSVSAKIAVPATWNAGLYAVRLENDAGLSAAIYLNHTELWWWIGGPNPHGSEVAPGDTVRAFGRNLGTTPSAYLLPADGGIGVVTLTPMRAATDDDYNATFSVPDAAALGSYDLAIGNGFGGALGFSATLPLSVASAPSAWPTTRFDVTTFGAVGDGGVDDSTAFQAAFSAAGMNDGGVVYVPAGTYLVRKPLVIPPNTLVEGASPNTSILTSDAANQAQPLIAGDGHLAIAHLGLRAEGIRRLFTCPDDSGLWNDYGVNESVVSKRCVDADLEDLDVENDTVWIPTDAGPRGFMSVLLFGQDLRVRGSTFTTRSSSPLLIVGSRHSQVSGNTFYDGNGYLPAQDVSESVIEGNEVTHAPGLIGNTMGFQGNAIRLYIARNNVHDGNGSYGEGITFDTSYDAAWLGTPLAANGTGLTLGFADGGPGFADSGLAGLACTVIGGTGMGQQRQILDAGLYGFELVSPFDLPLDSTSVVAVLSDKTDTVLTKNRIANASVAVQLYSQGYGFIIDGNDTYATGGSYAMGWDFMQGGDARRRFSVDYFNTWLNNSFDGGYSPDSGLYYAQTFKGGALGPLESISGFTSAVTPPLRGISHLGAVVRANRISGAVVMGAIFGSTGPPPTTPPTIGDAYLGRDAIFEDNVSNGAPLGLGIWPWYVDSLVRGNQITGSPLPYVDRGTGTWSDLDGG